MTLGAYVLVRFANDVRDERLNLGVLVWHPGDGFHSRFLSSFDRVRAIDPTIRLQALHRTVNHIIGRLDGQADGGRRLFAELSAEFREGLQVSGVFPARLNSLEAMVDRLYSLLVEPPEADGTPLIASFQAKLEWSLRESVLELDPNGLFEDLGSRYIGGASVNVGVHVRVRQSQMIWRGVSLRTNAREDQLARAKATAMDIIRVRSLSDFSAMRQVVAVESPRKAETATMNESRQWLRSAEAEIVEVSDVDELPSRVEEALQTA